MLGNRLWQSVTRLISHRTDTWSSGRDLSTATYPLLMKITPCLFAEPLKKKKKLDPAILKAREEKRKRKLEKQIRRLEKNARQLKPIDEVDVAWSLLDEKAIRTRIVTPLTPELHEERQLLLKEWTRYKHRQHLEDLQQIDKLICSQQKALDELRAESEELYQEAIQVDMSLIPFQVEGPVRTPPIDKYNSPDGEYVDISKKWV